MSYLAYCLLHDPTMIAYFRILY